MAQDQAALLLSRQLKDLNKSCADGFSAGLVDDDDLFKWEIVIYGPPETVYEGGFFKCHLVFPKEYPQKPPEMTFVSQMWHPNIDSKGRVCISILHEPGDDKYGYERASERWLPVHTVETICISVISMLADPNDESPANVDAAVSSFPMHDPNFVKQHWELVPNPHNRSSRILYPQSRKIRKCGGKTFQNLRNKCKGQFEKVKKTYDDFFVVVCSNWYKKASEAYYIQATSNKAASSFITYS